MIVSPVVCLSYCCRVFFFKQTTAYELRIRAWSSDVCSSDLDTLAIARQRHPGAKHTLDALCTRFGIDRSHRVLHGALLDAQLLAQVYVELTGGRQIGDRKSTRLNSSH